MAKVTIKLLQKESHAGKRATRWMLMKFGVCDERNVRNLWVFEFITMKNVINWIKNREFDQNFSSSVSSARDSNGFASSQSKLS